MVHVTHKYVSFGSLLFHTVFDTFLIYKFVHMTPFCNKGMCLGKKLYDLKQHCIPVFDSPEPKALRELMGMAVDRRRCRRMSEYLVCRLSSVNTFK